MRDWLENLDEIDQDCVHQYEYLLGRELTGYEEYHEIDGKVNEMILEFETREDFFEYYPELLQYANPALIEALSGNVKEARPEEQKKETINLWGRLGISLEVTPEEMTVLGGEDMRAAQDLLVKLIQSDRCQIDGNTYFPYKMSGREDNPEEDLDFELDPTPLHPEQVYCLCEEYENDDGIREFSILAVSTDEEYLQKQMQKIITDDNYGFIKDKGVAIDGDNHFQTNFENGFVEYYIERNQVLSREDLKRSLGEEKKPSLAERINEANTKVTDANSLSKELKSKGGR